MEKGLTEQTVLENRKKYGSNEISKTASKSFIKLLLETLGDPIIKILLVALGIKIMFLFKDFDWYETLGILIAILIASLVSTISEYGSEKAFKRLQEETSKIKCKVRRNNITKEINIDEIVKDDLVILSSGDKVPADGTLIKGELLVDESSLTGESKEIEKNINDKLFRGSVIYQKTGIMKVELVGDNTYYGRISKELQEKSPESPLKNRLRDLAQTISKIGYVGAVLGAVSYLFSTIIINNNYDLNLIKEVISNFSLMLNYLIHAITIAVTIIIVAVPEGLPMMITLVLSSNMKRMLKKNVLVRKMVGIETAGSMNMLFFDKTGTITIGKPKVIYFIDPKLNKYTKKDLNKIEIYEQVEDGLLINNESTYDDNSNIVGGNQTDKAILEFIGNKKIKKQVLKIYPFNSTNKYSKTIIKRNNEEITLIKGAPEIIFSKCNTYYDKNRKRIILNKNKIKEEIEKYVKTGSRVLCLAEGENNLTLIGFIIIKDEIRKESKEAIKELKEAGIKQIMITGDNKDTAISIAKDIDLITKEDDLILTSTDLNNLTEMELIKKLPNIKVIARALPTDKSKLVKIAQKANYIVGMTGDGVNDAPALKKADVGFGMGSGTEVAKEASDIVILDDNISSIAEATLFGRTIFKSIRKFIIFQLTLNICAVLVSIVGPLLGVNTPVTVMQMLWINMIMDTLAGLAFSYEAPLKEYMKEPPKDKNEKIINKYMKNEILISGLYSALLSIIFLKSNIIKSFFRPSTSNEYLFTAFFGFLIFIGIFNSFNARTHRINLLSGILKNKVFLITFLFIIITQIFLIYFGGTTFRTSGLTFKELQIMILISFTIIPIDIIRKIILRTKGNKDGV